MACSIRGRLLCEVYQPYQEREPLIWDAIRFGSVIENVVVDP